MSPECCANAPGAQVWRYSCELNVALGFRLAEWCALCTDVGNRLGWKVPTRIPQQRGVFAKRHLFGLHYLARDAMITNEQGHGDKVTSTGTTRKQARDACALCQRPDIYGICVVCKRRCCFQCPKNLFMFDDCDTMFCMSCNIVAESDPSKDKNL